MHQNNTPTVTVSCDAGGFSSEVLNKVNGIRKSRGLPALQWQQSMDSAAARHSYDMSGKRQMSHSGACRQTCWGSADTATAAARGALQHAIIDYLNDSQRRRISR